MSEKEDVAVLRDLAKEYSELAHKDIQEERRALWKQNNSLKPTRPMILATYGMWNVWCREYFPRQCKCTDSFYYQQELALRMLIFQDSVGDDSVLDPWFTLRAVPKYYQDHRWGLKVRRNRPGIEGGSFIYAPPIQTWDDLSKLKKPHHHIDEERTTENADRLQNAFGDVLEVNRDRSPAALTFWSDISYELAQLRGLEQIMVDMYESPDELHSLISFLQNGIIGLQEEAEKAGDWSLTSQVNQSMVFSEELESSKANAGSRKRKELWCHLASQEFAGVSPAMHEEFLLRYQLPIISKFGLSTYGCCEDLTEKIDMLRQVPNLRIIAVSPRADVAKCAEQIGTDYVISWRPNPTDMICSGFDEERIVRIMRQGLKALAGCRFQIHLKDIETVEGETERIARWVQIVRRITEN